MTRDCRQLSAAAIRPALSANGEAKKACDLAEIVHAVVDANWQGGQDRGPSPDAAGSSAFGAFHLHSPC
jgi:hypothetical protein